MQLFCRQTLNQIHRDLEDPWDSTRSLVLGGFMRDLWGILEDSGRFWRVLEDSGGFMEDSGGFWRILEDSGGFWRILEDFWGISGGFLEDSG